MRNPVAEKIKRLFFTAFSCILFFLVLTRCLSGITGLAQKRPEKDGTRSGPKRPELVKPAADPEKNVTQVKIVRVPVETFIQVPPSKGYLSLFTTPEARITLSTAKGGIKRKSGKADEKGIVSLQDLAPGRYVLRIEHEDYQSLTDTITIDKGKQTCLKGELTSKYGTIKLGLGEQADGSVIVQMDGEIVLPPRLKTEKGMISIPRVPVGEHRLRISKDNYEERLIEQHKVGPGEQNDPLVFDLKPITITLTIKTLSNAQIYLDGALAGRSSADGVVSVPDLLPGTKKLRVLLDGYETLEREVTLTREQRQLTLDIRLNPITEDAEFSEDFDPTIDNWWPKRPDGWELISGKGLQIRGDQIALCKNTSKPNRSFNYYYDFDLHFNVSFTNGKGAAWVVRAKDERNYYLFELSTSGGPGGKPILNFSVCRDGQCAKQRSFPVFARLDHPGDSFDITLKARGKTFAHWIKVYSDPAPEKQQLGGIFEDETFAYGGIGFRACNGLETFVRQIQVIPSIRQSK